jgi:hypothetical protein
VLDINRPEFDVGQALSPRLGPGQHERRLGEVEAEYLPGGADYVRGGERGGARTATCVKDTVSRAQAYPGDGLTAEAVPERQRGVVEVIGGGRISGR